MRGRESVETRFSGGIKIRGFNQIKKICANLLHKISFIILVKKIGVRCTLNHFDFDGNYYQQVGGVAIATKMGPSYACLFVGYIKRKMFEE